MLSRRSLLRLMIGCLAFTAFIGVAGVFLGGWHLMGRLAGTAFAGAITALLMLRASVLMDRSERYRAGYFTMWLALAQFAIAFAAIWASWLDETLQMQLGSHLWGTLFVVFVTGWPAATFVGWLDSPATRIASRVALAFDAVVFVMLFAAVWSSSYSIFSGSDSLYEYAMVFATHGLVISACLVGLLRGDRQWWRWIGVASTALAAMLFCYGIWQHLGGDPKLPATFIMVGLVFAHQNLMFLVPLKGKQNIIRNLTVALSATTFTIADLLIWSDSNGDTFLTRVAVATGILATCGTLTMLVLAKLNHVPLIETTAPRGTEQADADAALPRQIAFNCPICAKPNSPSVGDSACDGCGLLFTIKLTTPRCNACGSSLLHNKADACPECGAKLSRPVPNA